MDRHSAYFSGSLPLAAVGLVILLWIAIIFINGVSQTLFLIVSSVLLLALGIVCYNTLA